MRVYGANLVRFERAHDYQRLLVHVTLAVPIDARVPRAPLARLHEPETLVGPRIFKTGNVLHELVVRKTVRSRHVLYDVTQTVRDATIHLVLDDAHNLRLHSTYSLLGRLLKITIERTHLCIVLSRL